MTEKKQYYPQLDSLRAIAVLLVIVSHWFAENHFLNKVIPNGIWGVTLFFVLSGYLITGILLKAKTDRGNVGTIKIFKVFYIRRALRIFPAYYLLLAVLFFAKNSDFMHAPLAHVLYVSNFYFYFHHGFDGSVSHFWSLSVEEQFYLCWPFIVLLYPWKKLSTLFAAGVIISIGFRLYMINPPLDLGRLLMPGSLDSFCLGGAFAYGQMNKGKFFLFLEKHFKTFLLGSICSVILIEIINRYYHSEIIFSGFYFTVLSVLFALVIYKAALGIKHPLLKRILNNPVLIFIGRISYGIYLFHNFIPYFYIRFPSMFAGVSIYFIQLLRLIVLIAIASISWFLFERPINNLKNYFAYSKTSNKKLPNKGGNDEPLKNTVRT